MCCPDLGPRRKRRQKACKSGRAENLGCLDSGNAVHLSTHNSRGYLPTMESVKTPARIGENGVSKIPPLTEVPSAIDGCWISHLNHLSCVLRFWKHGSWWNSMALKFRERKRPKPGTLPCSQSSVQVERNRNQGLKPIISIVWLYLQRIASALWASVGQFYKVGTRITSEATMQMKRENSGSILFSMSVGSGLWFCISSSSTAPAVGLSKWTIRILSCLFSV